MYSIHLQEANDSLWLEMRSSNLEKKIQNLQNLGRSVMSVYDVTTQRYSTDHQEQTRGYW
jgi:hypothetical protein